MQVTYLGLRAFALVLLKRPERYAKVVRALTAIADRYDAVVGSSDVSDSSTICADEEVVKLNVIEKALSINDVK